MPHLPTLRARLGPALADEDLRFVIDLMEHVEGPAGTDILTRGELSDSLFILVEGLLSANIESDGRTLELTQIEPGHWFGELVFIDPGPSSATVTALEPFVALRLPSEMLPKLIAENPAAAAALLRVLTQEIAGRLAHTSSGVMERVDRGSFVMQEAEEEPGWFSELLSRLFDREARS